MTRQDLEKEIEKRESIILKNKNFLRSKDYQTIRELQGGEPMTPETKEACSVARRSINTLQQEIENLKEELKKCPEEHPDDFEE